MEKEKGDSKVRADFSRFVLSTLADQIKQADVKAFGILGVLGILTAALLARLNTIKTATGITPIWAMLFVLSAVLIVFALKFVVTVVYPRLSKSKGDSIIYFKDIAQQSKESYVKKGHALSAEETIAASYADVYALAQVANQKYQALRLALIAIVIAFIWTFIILLLSFQ